MLETTLKSRNGAYWAVFESRVCTESSHITLHYKLVLASALGYDKLIGSIDVLLASVLAYWTSVDADIRLEEGLMLAVVPRTIPDLFMTSDIYEGVPSRLTRRCRTRGKRWV
jgi:hypothetical protein